MSNEEETCIGLANLAKMGTRDRLFPSNDLSLLETGNFSDVRIVCGQRTWKCHRLIIASRCKWFQKALDGPFVEAKIRTIKLEDQDPDLVDAMIRYIYSRGDFDMIEMKRTKSESVFSLYGQVWTLADFFLLKPLKKDAVDGFKHCCGEKMKKITNVRVSLSPAELGSLIEELASGVKLAFHASPPPLACQRLLVDYAFSCRRIFFQLPEFIDLLEQEIVFGHQIFLRCMRAHEVLSSLPRIEEGASMHKSHVSIATQSD